LCLQGDKERGTQSLLDDIDKWQRAEQIRAYVSDVRRRVR